MLRYELDNPGGDPVTLATAKNFMKVNVPSDDMIIQLIIDEVLSFASNYTGRELTNNEWSAYTNYFSSSMEIRRSPVENISGITYIKDGLVQIIDDSVYELQKTAIYSCVVAAFNQSWPTDVDQVVDAIRIKFVTKTHPKIDSIILAMLRHISDSYENRGDDDLINNRKDPTEFYRSVSIPRF